MPEPFEGVVENVSARTFGILIDSKWYNKNKNSHGGELPRKGDKIRLEFNDSGYYTSWKKINGTQESGQKPVPSSLSVKDVELRRMNALRTAVMFFDLKKGSIEATSLTDDKLIAQTRKFEKFVETGEW